MSPSLARAATRDVNPRWGCSAEPAAEVSDRLLNMKTDFNFI
jgi:hypothetical protein